MGLNPPALLKSKKEWLLFSGCIVAVVCIQLLFYYHSYKQFIDNERVTLDATVITQYPKNDYLVLKLQSGHKTFYTTSREDLKDLSGYDVQMFLFLQSVSISFFDYLSTFYAPSFILRAYTQQQPAHEYIKNQHEDTLFQEFFSAIFLAKPISSDLRQSVASLGVSHLIALSGFHLGILSGILYFILRPPYRFFQKRYFPYRFELLDLGFIVAIVLGAYLIFTDFPPSLVRAYGMFFIGWLLVLFGVSIFTYRFLFFVVMVLIAIDPRLLFSLGFFFSVCGVFYIYMVLDWFKGSSKAVITLAITTWVFIAMLPITHYFFPLTSYYQLISPILTLLFSIFYPVALFLHTVGFGDLATFTIPTDLHSWDFTTPTWFYYSYILLSLLAIDDRFKPLLLCVALGFAVTLFLSHS